MGKIVRNIAARMQNNNVFNRYENLMLPQLCENAFVKYECAAYLFMRHFNGRKLRCDYQRIPETETSLRETADCSISHACHAWVSFSNSSLRHGYKSGFGILGNVPLAN